MYNPAELAKKTESIVTNENMKKYYRFRATGFYGGIATADTVGCNLRCKFCWSANSVWNAKNTGNFYSPEHVAERLHEIALQKSYSQMRISGGEPTIGRKHLVALLENISTEFLFILETNGILLGMDPTYVQELAAFKNLHVRVCLKGCTSEEFSWLTGAKEGFEYQLKALEHLIDENLSFNIALVSIRGNKQELFERLKRMNLGGIMIEEEAIKLYPHVRKRLNNEGILHYFEEK
ncbi:MAG: radical SAM protein [Thermoplasmatales archaeon]|nr:MAG: radical SAM protein [Thermoplasmatales archaeon]